MASCVTPGATTAATASRLSLAAWSRRSRGKVSLLMSLLMTRPSLGMVSSDGIASVGWDEGAGWKWN